MSEKPRNLPDKSIAHFRCVACSKLNFSERKGVENGFSYLEIPHGEIYNCDKCNARMKIQSNYMFGFVSN